MRRRPPRSTLTDTLVPYTTRVRAANFGHQPVAPGGCVHLVQLAAPDRALGRVAGHVELSVRLGRQTFHVAVARVQAHAQGRFLVAEDVRVALAVEVHGNDLAEEIGRAHV